MGSCVSSSQADKDKVVAAQKRIEKAQPEAQAQAEKVQQDVQAQVQKVRPAIENQAAKVEPVKEALAEKLKTEPKKEDSNIQRTFIMVKPDGVKRGRIGQIIKRFEKRGLRLKELRLCRPPQAKFEEHYAEHKGKPFFPPLLEYMDLGPVVQMVVEGPFAIQICRQMIGKTRPHESDAGTIRGDNGLKMRRNVIHGSDSVEGAEREIGVWFSDSLILEPPAAQ